MNKEELKEDILNLENGIDLNFIVGKNFIEEPHPRTRYLAMDGDTSGYFNTFDSKGEAVVWHRMMNNKFPNHPYSAEGGFILQKDFYPNYSVDSDFANKIDRRVAEKGLIKEYIKELKEMVGVTGSHSEEATIWAIMNASAEQKSKACILVLIEQGKDIVLKQEEIRIDTTV